MRLPTRCNTVINASRPGDQPGLPSVPNAPANRASQNSSPSSSRTRTGSGASRLPRYIARIARAICGSGSGQALGCIDIQFAPSTAATRKGRPCTTCFQDATNHITDWPLTCRELTSRVVFTTKTGAPLQPSNVNRDFHQLLRGAGLRKIRFHDLRHSCASLLLDQGVDLIVIKELLGHAHIAITADIYAHVRLRLQRDAIERMSGALDGPEL